MSFTKNMEKRKILFICTHNSARSQMCEGFTNSLYSDKYEAFSAGTEISKVKPQAIQVMKEVGIDISKHYSKHVTSFYGIKFDVVVTVCDNAKKTCPWFPGAKEMIHKSFPDPSLATGSDKEKLKFYRDVRDRIYQWIKEVVIAKYNQ